MTESVDVNYHSPELVSSEPPEHTSGPVTGGTQEYSMMQSELEAVKAVT